MTYPVWGWGEAGQEPAAEELAALRPELARRLGFALAEPERPAPLGALPADRVSGRLPPSLRPVASAAPADRARHGLGRSYRDVLRGIRGTVGAVPDCVLRPRDEAEVAAVLDFCAGAGIAVVPFGGGTSVVGGVEPVLPGDWPGVVSLDVGALSGVAEVDAVSRAARVGAGTTGPALERALKAAGLTARFYPQSFERSTVGGWVATRAAGHFATGPTHIDDLVEAVRAVTPAGVWASRRLPASGAGPSPDRLLLGSEGTLGVLTEVWLRVQPRPAWRWRALLAAPTFAAGADAVRAVVQAGLAPASCRLVEAAEAALTGTLETGEAALLLGLESVHGPAPDTVAAARELCAAAGLREVSTTESGGGGAGGAESWRAAFLAAPYLRERMVLLGVLVETFETAVSWAGLGALVERVGAATRAALQRACGGGLVTCRLTHAYPGGAAPYFTVLAPARRGDELAQWDEVKAAAADAVLAAGGTITHHHAVGRDHRRWYDAQRPDAFAAALAGAKAAVDPAGVLNPGVLVG